MVKRRFNYFPYLYVKQYENKHDRITDAHVEIPELMR
jgi:hypothetical protein